MFPQDYLSLPFAQLSASATTDGCPWKFKIPLRWKCFIKKIDTSFYIHKKYSQRTVQYQVVLFFLLKNVTNLHYHMLLIWKYCLPWVHWAEQWPEERISTEYSANFHYFCEMGWCVLLLPYIYIQYCYCQISEEAYLCLRHMSSRISLSKNILMYSLYCKHTMEIMPTWDIMKFAFAL